MSRQLVLRKFVIEDFNSMAMNKPLGREMVRRKVKTDGEMSIPEQAGEVTRATIRKVHRDGKLTP